MMACPQSLAKIKVPQMALLFPLPHGNMLKNEQKNKKARKLQPSSPLKQCKQSAQQTPQTVINPTSFTPVVLRPML